MELSNAFDELYRGMLPKVYSYFSLCFGREAADDLSQQVFLKVWMRMNRPTPFPDHWAAWIFRVAVNVKNDYLRKRRTMPQTVAIQQGDGPLFSLEEDVLASFSVETAFGRLCLEDREILLFKANGLSSEELGIVYHISASAARSRLAAARKRLKTILEELGVGGYE